MFGYVSGPDPEPDTVDAACVKRTPGYANSSPLGAETDAARSIYGFFAVDGSVPKPRKDVDTPIRITIDGPTMRRINEPLDIHVTFKNTGDLWFTLWQREFHRSQ